MSVRGFLQSFFQKEEQTLGKRMIQGASGTFFLRVANICLVIVTTLTLARLLGSESYGVFAYALSWVSLLSVPAATGLGTLVVREIAEYHARRNWKGLQGILHWSDRIAMLGSLGLAGFFCAVVWIVQNRFGLQVREVLLLAMVLLPFLVFISLRQGAVQGLGRVIEAQIPLMLVFPALFLVLVILWYAGFGLSACSAVGLRVLAAAVTFLVGRGLLIKYLPAPAKKGTGAYHSREWLRSSLALMFVGTAGIVNQQLSNVIVGNMLGMQAAGIFDVAGKGTMFVSFVLIAVNMPLAPTVADLHARGELERLQRLVTKSARVAFFGSLPVAAGLIFFGRWVLGIFGSEFTRGSTAIAILSGGQLVNVGMGSVALLLNMTGYEWDTAKGVGIAAALNVILSLFLVPVLDIEGAAIAGAVSMAAWNILLAVRVYQRLGIRSSVFELKRLKEWLWFPKR